MSHEKAEVVQRLQVVERLYRYCWAPANLDLVPEILHPDIVWTAIESAPDAGTRHGHAGACAYMSDWLHGFDFEAMPSEEVATTADGRLVCALRAVGTEKQSGLTTEIHYAGVFRFAEDGRILEIHEYATTEDAMEAVGLSEQGGSQENTELRRLAEKAFGALNVGDLDAFMAVTAEDVEFTSMVAEVEGTTFRGHDGIREWWETVVAGFGDVRWQVLDVRGPGDRGVAHIRMEGTLGGIPLNLRMWLAASLREGTVTRWSWHRTEEEALEAVGMTR